MKTTNQSLESYYALYRLALGFENKSPATLSNYFRYLNQFHVWLTRHIMRTPLLTDLNVEIIYAYVAYLRSKKKWDNNPFVPTKDAHLAPMTIVGQVRTLKGLATWLYEEGLTEQNVLKRLPLPKAPVLLTDTLTEPEIRRVFAMLNTKTQLGARDYAILILFLDSGIRCSELCTLQLDDVHLDTEPGWIKVFGKGGKERIVILGRSAERALLTYKTFIRQEVATNTFFVTRTGQSVTANSIQKMMEQLARRTGITRLHAHLLRHTAATQYLVAGGDALSLQQKLGHSTLLMTSHYVHLANQDLARIQKRVSPVDQLKLAPLRRRAGVDEYQARAR